jgi:hypothetical protein
MKYDTSIRSSQICLRLYFVVDFERRKFCELHDLLPPRGLRGQKLLAWIDRRRRGDKRCRPKKIKIPFGQLELPLAA